MSNPTELLRAAAHALKTEKDQERAKKISQQILDSYPDSKEAGSARLIVDRVNADAKRTSSKTSEEVYSAAEWDGVTPKTLVYNYESKYGVARATASFIEFVGYLSIVLSVVVIFLSADKADVAAVMTGAMLLPLFIGALIVMLAQLVKATLDNADNTGELLAIMKARDDL